MSDYDVITAILDRAGVQWETSEEEGADSSRVIFVDPDLRFGNNHCTAIGFDKDGDLLGMAPF